MLLVVYATLLVKPVVPYFVDIAQHIFNYSEHITTVHFENGKYHVHNELKEAAKKRNQQKESPNLKKDSSQNECIGHAAINKLIFRLRLKKTHYHTSSNLVFLHLANDYPPPKV